VVGRIERSLIGLALGKTPTMRWSTRRPRDGAGAGGEVMPALGIKGTGHMMMMDKNNLQIADLIINWVGQSTAGVSEGQTDEQNTQQQDS
jgi:hypothetical protein